MTNKTELIPAILETDSLEIIQRLHQAEGLSHLVQLIQLDIADGQFVKNKTPLPGELPTLPKSFRYIFHLMVETPEKYKADIEKFKPETVIFHLEATENPQKTWQTFQEIGKVGVAINPGTPPEKISQLGQIKLDEILILTVEPGFAGQSFIKESGEKIKKTKKLYPETTISVDGGIKPQCLPEILEAGAQRIYVSSYLFKDDKIELNFKKLLDYVNR